MSDPDPELQDRLALFALVMFWAFVVFRAAEIVLYLAYPAVEPEHRGVIAVVGVVSLLVLVATWRLLLRIPRLSRTTLRAIDFGLMAHSAAVFGATTALAYDRHEAGYTCLIYAYFMVLVRALVVPSTGRRTALVTTISMVPLLGAALYLAVETVQDVPGPAFFAGACMYSLLAIAIASAGSDIIYGLRRRAALDLELGQYRLDRRLGAGPNGEVFLARHALLRRPTAIKLMRPDPRFERAVQQMSLLAHHNTVAVFDYGRSPDGTFYFAMEYLEGLDLETLVQSHGAQPEARVAQILGQLCDALHEADGRGFAHGNIKPSNVILCERGGLRDVAKLTDYGFAADGADDRRMLADLAAWLLGEACATSPILTLVDDASSIRSLRASLRSLGDGWTQSHARDWWAALGRRSLPSLPIPTTIEVDLAERAGSQQCV